jgi:hypothetical protein
VRLPVIAGKCFLNLDRRMSADAPDVWAGSRGFLGQARRIDAVRRYGISCVRVKPDQAGPREPVARKIGSAGFFPRFDKHRKNPGSKSTMIHPFIWRSASRVRSKPNSRNPF